MERNEVCGKQGPLGFVLLFQTRECLGVGPGLCTVVYVVLVFILQMPGTPHRVVITQVPRVLRHTQQHSVTGQTPAQNIVTLRPCSAAQQRLSPAPSVHAAGMLKDTAPQGVK